jgi:hypothetical protein
MLAGLGGVGGAEAYAGAVPFQLVSYDVTNNKAARTATFTLVFNRTPDFSVQGEPARQVNAFQCEIDADYSGFDSRSTLPFNDIDTVIRGSEIWEGNGLPIRNRDGNGGQFAGGWGPAREFVPLTIDANVISFTTAWGALGDTDGRFRYRLYTTDAGQLSSEASGAVIPLPPAAVTGGAVLVTVGLGCLVGRRRRRSRAWYNCPAHGA